MSNDFGTGNGGNNLIYRDSNFLSPQSPEMDNSKPHGYSSQAPYQTSGSGGMNNNRNDKNKNDKDSKNKTKKDSFGVKVGKTAVCALVFGAVAGGTIFGINAAGGRAFPKNDAVIEQSETEDELERAFKEKSDKEAKKAAEEAAAAKQEAEEAKSEVADSEKEEDATTDDSAEESGSDQAINVQETTQSSGATVTLDYDVADIVEKTQPSIVSITTTGTQTVQSYFQVYSQPTSGAG